MIARMSPKWYSKIKEIMVGGQVAKGIPFLDGLCYNKASAYRSNV